MAMVVHKTVEECDDAGNNCQENEIQVNAQFVIIYPLYQHASYLSLSVSY